jgi:hypothetical protein
MALQKCFHNRLQILESAHRVLKSLGSTVGIVTDYRLGERGVGVRIPVRSLLRMVKTGSGAYQASYPICTGGYFPAIKAACA